jgi:calcineurin-like phosphoesterase family protein
MREIFVISDTHFNHANMLKFTDADGQLIRPFNNVLEMNEMMVDNWNRTVRDQDIIYHLGDVYMTNGHHANAILHRLRGRKRLILGNHDNGKDQVLHKHFQKITLWRMWPDLGLILSHVPMHQSSFRKAALNVHGHIHASESPGPEYRNVCVEKTNYTPVNIEELRVK